MTSHASALDLLIQEILKVLSADQLDEIGRRTKFLQRKRKMAPIDFLYLCLGESQPFLQRPLTRLCSHLLSTREVNMSAEGLNQRFSDQAVSFSKEVFFRCLILRHPTISIQKKIFSRIRVADSTGFSLPITYEDGYIGSTTSGVKIQLEYDLVTGTFLHVAVRDGIESDIHFAKEMNHTLLPNDLCIRDLGYFSIESLKDIDEQGAFYISRLRTQTKVYIKEEESWREVDLVQIGSSLKKEETYEMADVYIGHKKQYVPRLVIYHLTDEQLKNRFQKQERTKKKKGTALTSCTLQKNTYNYIITNISQDELSSQEIYQMYSLRWQIEILFKTWKSIYEVNKVRKVKKERFECHLYSTLIAILITSSLAFQARYYLYKKEKIEISEYKAIGFLRDYFPCLLKDKEKDHSTVIFQAFKRHGCKTSRGKKQTSGTLLKEMNVI